MLKKYIDNVGLCLGIIGLLVFMWGLVTGNADNRDLLILFATFILFLSAVIQREPFFIGLQGIGCISSLLAFFEINIYYSTFAFVILALIFAIRYFLKNKINWPRICAFIGLFALCVGIILRRNEPMVICGLFLAIYAYFSIKEGYSVGWVFLILNLLFAMVALSSLHIIL